MTTRANQPEAVNGSRGARPSQPHKNRQPHKRRPTDSPDVKLSKLLSYILRHGAAKEGLQLREDGSISLKNLCSIERLQNTPFEQIKRIVDTNDKKRYTLFEEAAEDGSKEWFIRATQGHTIEIKRPPLVKLTAETLPKCIVHGTTRDKIPLIKQTGLSRMRRTHIHFAPGLSSDKGVISGMRTTANAFVWVDGLRAMEDGIDFYLSENGVILSSGLGETGAIPEKYFKDITFRN
ncbi:tRNA 2'-phosphotransferase [Coemansia sp. RSA 1813]|nr:tRNA 2'-phosphotransferase [Coemansia sp. RSA 1646]KAJ1772722.1 tRNA 2'-phosphotransferase [Coemansia sp. RSA 1843]KAJ2090673.1 tRNA 2'-phosphotransferase [Coemansia sp. RSA 986]KAJ2216122.1 tRNA 2'-phosphotransferase [Coemansia sp. RSA 487]KAJ2570108.1 tRNA 2'-phosphotransferase [Coemansia sp. RSA 1813]